MSNSVEYEIVCNPAPLPSGSVSVYNDIDNGNQVAYAILNRGCPLLDGVPCGASDSFGITEDGLPIDKIYTIQNSGNQVLEIGTVSVSGYGFSILSQPAITSLVHGEQTSFVVHFDPGQAPDGEYSGTITMPSNDPSSPCVWDSTGVVGSGGGAAQGDGPFVFPPGSFPSGDGTLFYTSQLIEGANYVKFVRIPNNPNGFDCSTTSDNPCSGVQAAEFGGMVTYDINTTTTTGVLFCDLFETGVLPGAGSNYFAHQGTQHIEAFSIDSLLSALVAAGGGISAQNYFEYQVANGSYFRVWISTQPSGGYFVFGFMNCIYCPGHVVTALTR